MSPRLLMPTRWPALSGLALAFLLAGCGGKGAAGGAARTVCFAFQDLETEFWVGSHQAITGTLRARGMVVVERNASQDANRQYEQVRDCLAQDVDAVVLIPQDGESAATIVGEANRAGVPIGVYNRPPSGDRHAAVVVVADNERLAEATAAHLAEEARRRGRRAVPLVMVGDLGDPNAVARRKGFYNVVRRHPDLFAEPVEVPTKWDANTALANLEAAMRANPNVDLIFNSSDFMHPQVRAVLEPLGKWRPAGDPAHVILGGIDGDRLACRLLKEGYVDATGVQNLGFEADTLLKALVRAVEAGEERPRRRIADPGFALTRANLARRERDTWGCQPPAGAAGARAASR